MIRDGTELGDASNKSGVVLGEPDCYSSVIASAFGDVQIVMRGGQHAKVHPIAMLILCFPAFIAQCSTLHFLRFHMVHYTPRVRDDGLLGMKIFMVAITYLMNSQRLLQAVRLFLFLANPITWVEVAHASPSDWVGDHNFPHILFNPVALVPWPMLAAVMNFTITYMVCADSVSIILSSETAQDAVFDCLAVGFIAEMAAHWWNLCAFFLHLNPLDEHEFWLKEPSVWLPGTDEFTPEVRETLVFSRFIEVVVRFTRFKHLRMRHSVLRIGHGARQIGQCFSALVLGLVYTRQLFIVLHAIESHILPVIRDMCAEVDLLHRPGFFGSMWRAFTYSLFANRLDRLETGDSLTCTDMTEQITLDYIINDLLPRNQALVGKVMLFIFLLMIVPTTVQILHMVHARGHRYRTPQMSLRQQAHDLEERMARLKVKWESLQAEMQNFHEGEDVKLWPLEWQ